MLPNDYQNIPYGKLNNGMMMMMMKIQPIQLGLFLAGYSFIVYTHTYSICYNIIGL
jgi:hypothetical protein